MSERPRVYVAGHAGLAGSAIVRRLEQAGHTEPIVRTSTALDLRDPAAVDAFFSVERPDWVFLAAARVGGIHANSTRPAEFLRDNLLIQTNVVDAAYRHGSRKLLFLGSSCIYPKFAPQPLREEYLLTGPLEPTNEWYAVAKIAGIKLCQAYRRQHGFDAICLMPTNLYGPGDNFDPVEAHVLPALLQRFDEARQAGAEVVAVWGSGEPRREFLHADDLADAAVHLMQSYSAELPINVGSGQDVSIRELAQMIAAVTGYRGRIEFDASRPDGTPRKVLDVTRVHELGWRHRIELTDGLRETYAWFTRNPQSRRARGAAPCAASDSR